MWVFIALITIVSASCDSEKVQECRLQDLRTLMTDYEVQAYIIPSSDDHNGEFVSAVDKRREFISGFTGSTGTAVVTQNEALLWTDSRYYLQAIRELNSTNWKLVPRENSSSIDQWLTKHLDKGSRVAVDPKKMVAKVFKTYSSKLNGSDITLVALEENLVDKLWENKPKPREGNVFLHPIEYAGETYESKLKRVRQKMEDSKTDLFVIAKLDEIAWLLNLRGSDGEHTPTFVSYMIIKKDDATLYTNISKVPTGIRNQLQKSGAVVKVQPYEQFWNDWKEDVTVHQKVLVPESANYQIYSKVPEDKVLLKVSPIQDMKAQKNAAEVQASRNAHIRDAVAICKLYYQMEREVPNCNCWDELKASDVLSFYRSQQKDNMGSSFPSIIAFGKNSALPHYIPTNETNLMIDTTAPLTLDTGGQYLDGTIDTTRVWHFGNPTAFQKKVYTAILQGVADLATTIFPANSPAKVFDFVTRRPLLKHGLTFGHGTTHGTGIFLDVHEDYNGTMFNHFIGSQEPGFYKKDDFGMRLENLIVVVPSPIKNEGTPDSLLSFSALTLVPYEAKLIQKSQLDKSQLDWINDYHNNVRKLVGDEMIKQRLHSLYKWLMDKTNPI